MILSLLRIQDLVPRSTWLQPIKLLPAIFLYVFIPDQCYRSIFSWIVPRIEIVYNKILYDENISRERIDLVDELNRFIEKKEKKKRKECDTSKKLLVEAIHLWSYLAMLIGPRQIFIASKQCQVVYNRQPCLIVTDHFHWVLVMWRAESVIRECTIKFSPPLLFPTPPLSREL